MPLALLSVSDKTGIVDFARGLAGLGFTLLSTGGTARLLSDAGLTVTEVGAHTGFPEMLDGRVKTLHPKVHGGLLGRPDLPAHAEAMRAHGIEPISILAVNLYPFVQTVARVGVSLAEAIENIDIGGPAMVRAAAKNYEHVAVLTDPADYGAVLDELRAHGAVGAAMRFALCRKAYTHTALYDAAISGFLSSLDADAAGDPLAAVRRADYPGRLHWNAERLMELRYGENPHQSAALYRDAKPPAGSLACFEQLQGKELSYNNLADADAAWECVKTFDAAPACVIVKHANPCGVGLGADPAEAYARAFATDPTSAFGGIIAFNRPLDGAAAQAVAQQFVEVLLAPAFTPEALAVFAPKKNVRLLRIALPAAGEAAAPAVDLKRIGGGLLVQSADTRVLRADELRVVSRRQPTPQQTADALFAWKVAKFVKSNAIVFCAGGRTLGIGAGQMSRIDSARIAGIKAAQAGLDLAGSVVASDAFFPFRDGLDAVADAGAACVIQPGGSVRDQEVIDAADERGLVMWFTGVRHFRH
jgi:phosphoribosylaminoimidazolecarboxamide formyltransferase/IMP cyclohydrolase